MSPSEHSRPSYSGSNNGNTKTYREDNKRPRKYMPSHHNKYNGHHQYQSTTPPYCQKNNINPFSSRRQEQPGAATGSLNSPQGSLSSNGDSYGSYRSSNSHDSGYGRNSFSSGGPRRSLGYRPSRGHHINGPSNGRIGASSSHYFRSYSSDGNPGGSNGRYSNSYYGKEHFRMDDSRQSSVSANDDNYSSGRWGSGSRDRITPHEDEPSKSGDLLGGLNNKGGDLILSRDYRYNRGGMRDYRPSRVHSTGGGYARSQYRDEYRSEYREEDDRVWNERQKYHNHNRPYDSASLESSQSPMRRAEVDEGAHKTGNIEVESYEHNQMDTAIKDAGAQINLANPSSRNDTIEATHGPADREETVKEELLASATCSKEASAPEYTEEKRESKSSWEEKTDDLEAKEVSTKLDIKLDVEKDITEEMLLDVKHVRSDKEDNDQNAPTKELDLKYKKVQEEQKTQEEEEHEAMSEEKDQKEERQAVPAVEDKIETGLKSPAIKSQEKNTLIGSVDKKVTNSNIVGAIAEATITVNSVNSTVGECIFPLNRVETKFNELKNLPEMERRKTLKYLQPNKLFDLRQYNFYNSAFVIFKQADGPNLLEKSLELQKLLAQKKKDLTEEYIYRKHLYEKRVSLMDEQLSKFYNIGEPESRPQTGETSKTEVTEKPLSGRRGRHHGDAVRTEAEFLEILATLEKEREKDPMVRAQHGCAKIPDMMINPVERYATVHFLDTNNMVRDKSLWAKRIELDSVDTFTQAEHEKFCEAYSLWPKKFGRISSHMGGLRTPEECVLHYYRTKKQVNFKQIVANKNRRATRKASSTKRKSKDGRIRTGTHTPEPSTAESANISIEGTLGEPSDEEEGTDINKRRLSTSSSPTEKKKQKSAESLPVLASSNEISHSNHETSFSLDEAEKGELNQKTATAEPLEKPKKKRGRKKLKPEGPSSAQKLAEAKENAPLLQSSNGDPLKVASEMKEEIDQKLKDTPPYSLNDQSSRGTVSSGMEESEKKKEKHKDKSHITSYWSVQEISLFPDLLQKYGTDWETMSRHITTKTSTMVRNYYQRGLSDNATWEEMAREADLKRAKEKESLNAQSGGVSGPPLGYFYDRRPSTSKYTIDEPKPASSEPASQTIQLPALHTYYPSSAPAGSESSVNSTSRLPAVSLPNKIETSEKNPPLLQVPYPANTSSLTSLVEAAGSVQDGVDSDPKLLKMNSLLNTVLQPPNLRSSTHSHLPPLTSTSSVSPSSPFTSKLRSSIRSLLNDEKPDSNPQHAYPATNFKDLMSPNDRAPDSSGKTMQNTTGMSALDALAQVAFERK
ncbi:hypothetical protein KL935_000900 [Ogataea polymorpha]|uniref:SANT domain-containing protein n=2 Tax=Saccharomycotina TaxID=147537 RepID=A0A9P8PE77_9ASCO|nr:hypothetical protein KL935_000900 [Ogataea polymorpha]KAG7920208.1 hypothetical protein KL927_000888 [Ogataea polymorpha]KAH3669834.1 hypothetical protein OGATHE_002646 [Ogataea polymorpha]